jgi:chromosome partitioning protein
MRIIAICNPKGGTGKTTTAVNLGAALAAQGSRVLIIDMDPQGSASSWLGVRDSNQSVYRAIRGNATFDELVHETSAPGVVLVPSSPMLVVDSSRQEAVIAIGFMRAMESLRPNWDLVLIDCAPTLGYLAAAPIAASQGVLVPVAAQVLALSGLASLMTITERARERMNPRLEIDGILVCRANGTRHSRHVIERIGAAYPSLLMRTQIRESARLAEAPGLELPISRYAPGSTGDTDFRTAANELIERLATSVDRRQPERL